MKKLLLLSLLMLIVSVAWGDIVGTSITRDALTDSVMVTVENTGGAVEGTDAGFSATANTGTVYIIMDSGGDATISTTGGAIIQNIPTGETYNWKINGSSLMTLDATNKLKLGSSYVAMDDKTVTDLEGTGLSITTGTLNVDVGEIDLSDLGDTDISSPSGTEFLVWDGSNSWDNKTYAEADLWDISEILEIVVGSYQYFRTGELGEDTAGDWRLGIDGNGDLTFSKRNTGNTAYDDMFTIK